MSTGAASLGKNETISCFRSTGAMTKLLPVFCWLADVRDTDQNWSGGEMSYSINPSSIIICVGKFVVMFMAAKQTKPKLSKINY